MSNHYTIDEIIQQTKAWIYKVVIGCNFCPFAEREMKRGTVRFIVQESHDPGLLLHSFHEECLHLDADPNTETTLMILPYAFEEFQDYLQFLELAENLIIEKGYEGIYQVASFHPKYHFAGEPATDAANYTNRSPYPMLHLLREESIEIALEHYSGNADEIPDNNIRFAREKGTTYMKMLRDSCF